MSTLEIYNDIKSIDLGEKINKLQAENETLVLLLNKRMDDVERLCKELTLMKKTELSLKNNISELFNSSKVELERKNRQIVELQRQIDDLVFRRFSGTPGAAIKRLRTETYNELPPKRLKCEDELLQHHKSSKSRSSSPLFDSHGKHLTYKSRSKSPLFNSNRPTCKSDDSRSKSPLVDTRSKQTYKSSKSRSKSPLYNSRSKRPTCKSDKGRSKTSCSRSRNRRDVSQPTLLKSNNSRDRSRYCHREGSTNRDSKTKLDGGDRKHKSKVNGCKEDSKSTAMLNDRKSSTHSPIRFPSNHKQSVPKTKTRKDTRPVENNTNDTPSKVIQNEGAVEASPDTIQNSCNEIVNKCVAQMIKDINPISDITDKPCSKVTDKSIKQNDIKDTKLPTAVELSNTSTVVVNKNVNNETKETVITTTIRRRRRCVIQLN